MMYMLFVHSLCLALQVSPWRWGSQRTQHSPSMSTTSGHEEDVRLAHAIGDEPSVQAYLSLLARRTAAYMRQRDMRLSRSSHVDHDKHARVEQMVSSCAVYSPSESSKASFAGRVETLEQAVGVFDGYGNAREIMCNVYRFGVAVLLKDLVGSAALDVTTLEELYTAAGMGESGLAEMRRALALACKCSGKPREMLDPTSEFWDMPWTTIYEQFHKDGRRRNPAGSGWSDQTRAKFESLGGRFSSIEAVSLESELGAEYVPWSDPATYVVLDPTHPFYVNASRDGLPTLTGRSLSCLKFFMLDALLGLDCPLCCRCAAIAYFVPVGSHSVHEILDAAADEASNVYGGYAARCTYSATRQEASASNLLAGCEAELTRATQPRNVGSSLMIDRDWRSQKGECFDDSLRIMPSHAGSPVRLVDARYLVQLAERGEILRRRQDMPGHAFLGLDELREMSHLADALRVVVISKPW